MQTSNSKWISSKLLILSLTSLTVFGCGKAETNPTITIAMTGSATASIWDLLIPKAYAAATDVKFCFKRLRFKVDKTDTLGDTSGSSNVDFSPGEVTITSTTSELGAIAVPAGTYRRIELDLEKNCVSGSSANAVTMTNGSGSFSTGQSLTVRFDGEFTASESGQKLTLAVGSILEALDTVTADSDIKTKLEDVSVKGKF